MGLDGEERMEMDECVLVGDQSILYYSLVCLLFSLL